MGRLAQDKLGAFRRAAWATFIVSLLGLISLVTGLVWLIADGGGVFYVVTIATFFAALGALVLIAGHAARVLLR